MKKYFKYAVNIIDGFWEMNLNREKANQRQQRGHESSPT